MIRQLRKERDMTQSELAEKCGVTQAYISMLERNEKLNLSIGVLIKLAKALEVSLDELVSKYIGGEDGHHID